MLPLKRPITVWELMVWQLVPLFQMPGPELRIWLVWNWLLKRTNSTWRRQPEISLYLGNWTRLLRSQRPCFSWPRTMQASALVRSWQSMVDRVSRRITTMNIAPVSRASILSEQVLRDLIFLFERQTSFELHHPYSCKVTTDWVTERIDKRVSNCCELLRDKVLWNLTLELKCKENFYS